MNAPRMNPFPGMRPYEPEEDYLYFGRKKQTRELLHRLGSANFLAVVGASGSGKSSLVKCGLIPSLHGGYMPVAEAGGARRGGGSSWRVATLRPGGDPIGNLAQAMADREVLGRELGGTPGDRQATVTANLRRSSRGLVQSVREARLPEYENILIVVDQFEELFRFRDKGFHEDPRGEVLSFVRLLLHAAQQGEVPIFVVLTMRSDFIGKCTEIPGLAEAINDAQFLVPRMTREELREIIEGPVAVAGASIVPPLVLRLLNGVGDDVDQLPQLQHALMRTWDSWQERVAESGIDSPIEMGDYDRTGGLSRALDVHAETIYRADLTPEQRLLAKRIFKALTEKGAEGRSTRRPLALGPDPELEMGRHPTLCDVVGSTPGEVMGVLTAFKKHNFIVTSKRREDHPEAATIIDISHESLMRVWSRLREWVNEESRDADVYREILKGEAQWDHVPENLLSGARLAVAQDWLDRGPTEHWGRLYEEGRFQNAVVFVRKSQEEAQRVEAEAREAQRRKVLRARAVTSVVLVAAIAMWVLGRNAAAARDAAQVAQGAAVAARDSAQLARDSAQVAQRTALSARDSAQLARDSAQVAQRRALSARDSAQLARDSAQVDRRRAVVARDSAQSARDSAQVDRGRAVAARDSAQAARQETTRLLILAEAQALGRQASLLRGDASLTGRLALLAYAFNKELGGSALDPEIHVGLSTALARPSGIAQAGDAVRAVATMAGEAVAWGTDAGMVVVAGDTLQPSGGPVRALAADSQGRRVAYGDVSGTVRVWDSGSDSVTVMSGQGRVLHLAFAGDTLLVARTAGAELVYLDSGGRDTLAAWPDSVRAVTLWPERREILAGGDFPGPRRWALNRPRGPLPDLESVRVTNITALAGSGRLLAAGDASGAIHLITILSDTASPTRRQLRGHTARVTDLSFDDPSDPGERILASSSLDGQVHLWAIGTGSYEGRPIAMGDHGNWVWSVALTPDGARVYSGGEDKAVRMTFGRMDAMVTVLCQRLGTGYRVSDAERIRHLPRLDSILRADTARVTPEPAACAH